MTRYSIDCSLHLKGKDIDDLSLSDFKVLLEGTVIRPKLQALSDKIAALDFILYTEQESAETAEEFADDNMTEAIQLPDSVEIDYSDIQGVYNDELGFWEIEY